MSTSCGCQDSTVINANLKNFVSRQQQRQGGDNVNTTVISLLYLNFFFKTNSKDKNEEFLQPY